MRHFSYALLATSIVLIGAPAAIAQPSPLNITLDRPPLSALELGKQTGDKTCTGEGDAYTCVTPIGTQTALRDTVPALDNSTGSRGRLTVACTVMFSGTTTAYQTTTGTTEATGSQDCDLKFTFENGDAVFGAMHQTRVVQGTTQTSTFAFVFTGGAGKYDGFFGKFSTTEKSNWTPPPPLSEKGSKRLTTLRAGDGFAAISSRKTAGLKVKPTRKPLTSIATLGRLAPTNRPVVVKTATTPGATCTGSITGGTAIDLGSAKANAKGIATFKKLAAGAFASAASWNAKVTCTGSAGKSVGTTTLTSYEVLK